ncbi:hypothetical protein QFC21_000877 [Naganishia friedmannii]|uniref:Uncharacterized protein n=1 Tax=Naganishia friedmannii TaxID=89922 RepID=A0ACC2W9B1_9TREE|nr:hypothetical protein QFC21_000877 [Naganishia friedmannii]
MVQLDISETSKAIGIVGFYIVTIGPVSYFLKNRLFLSEALLALGLGIIVGPVALDWFSPGKWADSQEAVNILTFEITRIVIGIQVLFTGIALPKAYLWREKVSLAILLFPVMLAAWFSSALLIWGLIPGLTFLECLTIAACVTPTDPVLANVIYLQRPFCRKIRPSACTEHNRRVALSILLSSYKTLNSCNIDIAVAESGANDGLGFPFLYMGIYLILRQTPSHPVHTIGGAIGEWAYNILLYQILLSVLIGGVIGYVARVTLKWAEQRDLVDHDNFLAYGVGLTFFILGTVGLIGSDDILCCFVAGNAFTWDDWFRVQTEDHAFQDVIDTLLNSAIFLYIGSILPWGEFGGGFYGIQPWRLVVLGICIMVLRRVPWVVALHRWIPTLPTWKESAFAGFFGPIGVGAVFYVQVALEKLPEERERLRAVITPVVYFLILTSVVVHGVTIPLAKGFSGVRRLTITRSAGATSASGAALNAVSRLPQAPTTLPIDQGLVDEHDAQAAAKVEAPDGMGKNASAIPSRSTSESPSPENMSLQTPKTAIFPATDTYPEGIIRFQSTVNVEGHTRSPSDLNGPDAERLTKRTKEIHGSLPI